MLKRMKVGMTGCIAALVMVLAAACGGSTTNDEKESGGVAEQPPAQNQAETKPTELYFFSTGSEWWNEAEFMKNYGDPIHKKFPNIIPKNISITQMSTSQMDSMITSKQPIDVILAANYSYLTYVKAYDLQTDIEPLVKKQNIDLSRFTPEFIDMNKKMNEGHLTGLPLADYPTQILYNKAIFDKFGVPYPPKDRWTWDQMFELANKLTRVDGEIQYYGLRIHATYFRRNPYSLTYVDPKTNRAAFNNDTGKKIVETFLRQYEQSDTKGLTADGATLFFKDKVLAMWMPLGAAYESPDNYVGLDWDLAPVPYLPEKGDVSVQPYPLFLYVSKTSSHQDLAMQVIDYLTSEPFQSEISKNGLIVTALKNRQIGAAFGQNSSVFKGKNVSAMSPEKYAPPADYDLFNHQASASIVPKYANNVRDGKSDINSALRQAEEETNSFIDTKLTQTNK